MFLQTIKFITIWLLVFSFLAASFQHLATGTAYFVNKSYIVDQLCENKDLPMLDCDGKCYLKKEFEKQTEKEHNAASPAEKYIWDLIVSTNIFQYTLILEYFIVKVNYRPASLCLGYLMLVIQPPATV